MGEIIIKDMKVEVDCDTGEVSDGYHTFDELYEHRCLLFIALMHTHPSMAWRSKLHSDGTMFEGWFVAGMTLLPGPITYHLPIRMWELCDGVFTMLLAPEWDGHTPADVLDRLKKFIEDKA